MAGREETIRTQLRQPLPALTIIPRAHTSHRAIRQDRVDERFLFEWANFEDDVKTYFSQATLNQRVPVNDTAVDHIIVSNKIGVSGRFYQQVGQVVGKAWGRSGIDELRNFRFHDAQTDNSIRNR